MSPKDFFMAHDRIPGDGRRQGRNHRADASSIVKTMLGGTFWVIGVIRDEFLVATLFSRS
jgi:hypothetical protein